MNDEPNLDDPKIQDEIADDAIDYEKLQERNNLLYALNKQTPYTGWAKRYYKNSQLEFLGHYQAGKQHGRFTYWYENGQKKEERHYQNGELHGLWTYWHESGQKEKEEQWQDGEAHDLWTYWDKNGQKHKEEHYDKGKLVETKEF